MKQIIFIIISLIFLFTPCAYGDDTVKVLMLDSPYDPLPSDKAKTIKKLTGEIFINGKSHNGFLEIIKDEKGLYVVNILPFEKYVEGVVASEIGKNWEPEAVKAQAVISRTYAEYYRGLNAANSFHVSSSELHQLYRGPNIDPLITYAVQETNGEILVYDNAPIIALFHSSCEGKTEVSEEVWNRSYPYLKSVDCNGKNAPYENWYKKFPFEKISSVLGMSDIYDITISSHTSTGRVRTLKITGHLMDGAGSSRPSEMEVKAAELRRLLGYGELPSTQFDIIKTNKSVIFAGKGSGHGVGLSQWGALEMARQGKNYREILSHYYPGTVLKNIGELSRQKLASEK